MEGSEIAKRDHQRNKSEIVKLVKEMFNLEKWGDEEYKEKLYELVVKDEELVRDVIKKIKLEKGWQRKKKRENRIDYKKEKREVGKNNELRNTNVNNN